MDITSLKPASEPRELIDRDIIRPRNLKPVSERGDTVSREFLSATEQDLLQPSHSYCLAPSKSRSTLSRSPFPLNPIDAKEFSPFTRDAIQGIDVDGELYPITEREDIFRGMSEEMIGSIESEADIEILPDTGEPPSSEDLPFSLSDALGSLTELDPRITAQALANTINVRTLTDGEFGGPRFQTDRFISTNLKSVDAVETAIEFVSENPPKMVKAQNLTDETAEGDLLRSSEGRRLLPGGVNAAFLTQELAIENGIPSAGPEGVLLYNDQAAQFDIERELKDAVAAKAKELGARAGDLFWNWSEIPADYNPYPMPIHMGSYPRSRWSS